MENVIDIEPYLNNEKRGLYKELLDAAIKTEDLTMILYAKKCCADGGFPDLKPSKNWSKDADHKKGLSR